MKTCNDNMYFDTLKSCNDLVIHDDNHEAIYTATKQTVVFESATKTDHNYLAYLPIGTEIYSNEAPVKVGALTYIKITGGRCLVGSCDVKKGRNVKEFIGHYVLLRDRPGTQPTITLTSTVRLSRHQSSRFCFALVMRGSHFLSSSFAHVHQQLMTRFMLSLLAVIRCLFTCLATSAQLQKEFLNCIDTIWKSPLTRFSISDGADPDSISDKLETGELAYMPFAAPLRFTNLAGVKNIASIPNVQAGANYKFGVFTGYLTPGLTCWGYALGPDKREQIKEMDLTDPDNFADFFALYMDETFMDVEDEYPPYNFGAFEGAVGLGAGQYQATKANVPVRGRPDSVSASVETIARGKSHMASSVVVGNDNRRYLEWADGSGYSPLLVEGANKETNFKFVGAPAVSVTCRQCFAAPRSRVRPRNLRRNCKVCNCHSILFPA